ncbi:thioesterase family protein [Xylariomycetidae sp. FL0641]|nr:thioesterase family protein [Xylariomycetidae sp. FL0641]
MSFAEATKVEKLDSHAYRVNFDEAFCIGRVPNGGYAGACMLAAARLHLASGGHRDVLTAHFEYPGQTTAGPAIVTIEEVKLTRRTSTLHLTLWQGGLVQQAPWVTPSVSRRAVLAYTTHVDLDALEGLTVPMGYETLAAESQPPAPDFAALKKDGADANWELSKLPPGLGAWRSLHNWRMYVPRKEPFSAGVLDMWVALSSGERITSGALPYLVDSFPHDMNMYLISPEVRAVMLEAAQPATAGPKKGNGKGKGKEGPEDKQRESMWFPTLTMDLESKTKLPDEGVEWLAVRVTSRQMKDGKFDLDVVVRDEDGEMVALSHHIAMVVEIEKNTKKKEPPKSVL